MDNLKTTGWILLIASFVSIVYAIIFNPSSWIVYAISLVSIPLFILSLGLVTMAKGSKDEEEAKRREPFIGY
jgi:energy-converting hydrogenase A subunit I